jgi:hypothetical protein
MSLAFAARFQITYSESLGAEWHVVGQVFDDSLQGYAAADVQVGDIIIDESADFGYTNRWKITQINSASVRDLDVNVVWDDEGTEDPNGPYASDAAIARTSPRFRYAEIPTQALAKISETVQVRLQSIDNRRVDPLIPKLYYHTQSSASATWTIPHNLAQKHVVVF